MSSYKIVIISLALIAGCLAKEAVKSGKRGIQDATSYSTYSGHSGNLIYSGHSGGYATPGYSGVVAATPAYSGIVPATPAYSGVVTATPAYSGVIHHASPGYQGISHVSPGYSGILHSTHSYPAHSSAIYAPPVHNVYGEALQGYLQGGNYINEGHYALPLGNSYAPTKVALVKLHQPIYIPKILFHPAQNNFNGNGYNSNSNHHHHYNHH